ncbi:hypothetical protein ACFONL_00140 [Camelimonas fluminis]|uniref:Phasin protein n=1 Tax=Camelimonas fluminis TaxID=1576911 RepID=A0ABV7UBB9_9HYPH
MNLAGTSAASLLQSSKAVADAMMAEFNRVCGLYEHMEPDAMKFMPDYMDARRAAIGAVSNYEAVRAHVAKAEGRTC